MTAGTNCDKTCGSDIHKIQWMDNAMDRNHFDSCMRTRLLTFFIIPQLVNCAERPGLDRLFA